MLVPLVSHLAALLSTSSNSPQRQLVEGLRHTACQLSNQMQTVQQSKAVLVQYEAVWRQLLVCRRSELMCCIPLTSQRISQLQSIAAAAAVTAGQLIQALQSGLSTLTAFATVNKSTAEELQHDPGTAALARDKLQLSLLEESLATSLQQLITSSRQGLEAGPGPTISGSVQQQQCGMPLTTQHLSQNLQLQRANSALRPANSVTTGSSPATVVRAEATAQQVNPAQQAAAAACNKIQQQQQQAELLCSDQQQTPSGQQQQLQQQSLEQQQQILQQRQQQLELQLLQMGQLLQQQQQHQQQQQQPQSPMPQQQHSCKQNECAECSRVPLIAGQHTGSQHAQQQVHGYCHPPHLEAQMQQTPRAARVQEASFSPGMDTGVQGHEHRQRNQRSTSSGPLPHHQMVQQLQQQDIRGSPS